MWKDKLLLVPSRLIGLILIARSRQMNLKNYNALHSIQFACGAAKPTAVSKKKHTRQIAEKYPPLIPITLLGLKEKKISTKIDFCIKTFLSAIYFNVIL